MIDKTVKQLFIKEFSSYFKTPLGYVFLVIFLFGIGYLTFEPGRGSFLYMREASMGSFFRYIPWMFLFLIPAVSMRLWSDERKSGTITSAQQKSLTVNKTTETAMNFEGQTALITGAGRGIGKTIALRLARSGADIVLADMSPDVAEVRGEVEALGRKCMTFEVDVTNIETIDAMVKNITDELSGIHILVNNAGITQDNLFLRMKSEQWSKVIDVNLNGVFNVTKAVIRIMVKQRTGKIINISSVVGFTGNPGQVNYSSTKSALVGFTKSLAREVGIRGITVNAVAPGFIDTAMTQALNESQQEVILQQIPLGRMGDAEDIANAVSFLASKEASYITGTILHVNGGMY